MLRAAGWSRSTGAPTETAQCRDIALLVFWSAQRGALLAQKRVGPIQLQGTHVKGGGGFRSKKQAHTETTANSAMVGLRLRQRHVELK